ncbi:MAG: asparagine synthase C-terminal domain-containing protein [Nitrososphaerota archaeon]|nr:asparagine synthase C-terminal domain-containing protein [Nitrososphaerota archaeon]MDG7051025.1 asparagine synthase C-terminal domain-containing protein [Nitrososphaerota archaeon]
MKGTKYDVNKCQILGGYEIRNKLKGIYSLLGLKRLFIEEGGPLALILKHEKYQITANDYLGTLPIFYNEKDAAFDPSLLDHPIALPAGSILIKDDYGKPDIRQYIGFKIEPGGTPEELLTILSKYIELLPEKGLAIAFSGGLDSSLLAWLAKKKAPSLFTAGIEGSKDLYDAKVAAGKMGMSNQVVKITEADVKNAYKSIHNNKHLTAMDKALAVGFHLISQKAAQDGAKVLIAGQLADELFGGYKRYFSLSPAELNMVLEHDVLFSRDGMIRDSLAVLRGGLEPNFPYTHRRFVNMVLGMEPQMKIYDGVNKIALRRIGKLAMLPDSLVEAKKRAFQYSSGILKYIIKLGL